MSIPANNVNQGPFSGPRSVAWHNLCLCSYIVFYIWRLPSSLATTVSNLWPVLSPNYAWDQPVRLVFKPKLSVNIINFWGGAWSHVLSLWILLSHAVAISPATGPGKNTSEYLQTSLCCSSELWPLCHVCVPFSHFWLQDPFRSSPVSILYHSSLLPFSVFRMSYPTPSNSFNPASFFFMLLSHSASFSLDFFLFFSPFSSVLPRFHLL